MVMKVVSGMKSMRRIETTGSVTRTTLCPARSRALSYLAILILPAHYPIRISLA